MMILVGIALAANSFVPGLVRGVANLGRQRRQI